MTARHELRQRRPAEVPGTFSQLKGTRARAFRSGGPATAGTRTGRPRPDRHHAAAGRSRAGAAAGSEERSGPAGSGRGGVPGRRRTGRSRNDGVRGARNRSDPSASSPSLSSGPDGRRRLRWGAPAGRLGPATAPAPGRAPGRPAGRPPARIRVSRRAGGPGHRPRPLHARFTAAAVAATGKASPTGLANPLGPPAIAPPRGGWDIHR